MLYARIINKVLDLLPKSNLSEVNREIIRQNLKTYRIKLLMGKMTPTEFQTQILRYSEGDDDIYQLLSTYQYHENDNNSRKLNLTDRLIQGQTPELRRVIEGNVEQHELRTVLNDILKAEEEMRYMSHVRRDSDYVQLKAIRDEVNKKIQSPPLLKEPVRLVKETLQGLKERKMDFEDKNYATKRRTEIIAEKEPSEETYRKDWEMNGRPPILANRNIPAMGRVGSNALSTVGVATLAPTIASEVEARTGIPAQITSPAITFTHFATTQTPLLKSTYQGLKNIGNRLIGTVEQMRKRQRERDEDEPKDKKKEE